MTDITLDQARAIVAAAFAAGPDHGLTALTVVVTDPGSAIRAAERNEAAPPFGIAIAQAKARTALGFGRSSIRTAAVFGDKPAIVSGLASAVGDGFLPLGGGVVVVGPDGGVIGGAAVAGGAPDVDHAVIAAAVAAAGLAIRE